MTAEHVELDVFACPLDGVNLIEASAGTGKTWNICGLYLRLLLERGLAVDQILVVTFTNAATAELSGRIRERLVATLAGLEGRLAAGADPFVDQLLATLAGQPRQPLILRLKAALQGFDEAAIFTIHGFCQRALADTPFAAGLPFALELVTDDARTRREVAQDFWRREVAGGNLPAALARHLAAAKDSPETWAALLRRYLAKPLARVDWPETVTDDELARRQAELDSAYATAGASWLGAETALQTGCVALNGQTYKPAAVEQGAREWEVWLAAGDALAPLKWDKLKLHLYQSATIADKTKQGKIAPSHPFFAAAQALVEARQAADRALDLGRLALLRRLLEWGAAEVRHRKRAARQIAFDDMLFNLHEALESGRFPQLAAILRARFPAALIDEFQDTDPLQFAIFRRIYIDQPATLFLVGDPKQAIYSFRNADLPTYLAAKALADRSYTLAYNQRSVKGLIDACNALFSANPAVFAQPGLDYLPVSVGAKSRELFTDETEPPGGAALRVWRLPRGERLVRGEAMARAEAATAAEIARLLHEGRAGRITVGGQPLAAGHMAVLVKSHKQAGRIKRALAHLGVGSVELAQAGIFHSAEAEELERVLAAVAEPGRTGLLFAALATELLGWDAPALAALAQDEGALLPLLTRYAAYREDWLNRGFGVLFRRLLEAEGVGARLLARPDGERRLTNLLHLAELLQRAGAEHPGPEALLRWLADQRRDPAVGEEAQLRLESDRNLVQIVTIHRAKGLEYDVVFCPYLWDGHPPPGDGGEGLAYHADGVPVLDFRPAAGDDPAIAAGRRLERDAELLRQFYVALTRAVHRCYLVAGCYLTSHGKSTSPKQSAHSLLNWMVTGETDLPGWWEHKESPEWVEAAWQRLAESAAPHLVLLDLPAGPGQALPPDEPEAARLRALPPPRMIPAGWRIGSFSALAQGAHGEAAAVDHDACSLTPALSRGERGKTGLAEADASASQIGMDDILRFPRGPAAGDCLHAAFEAAEFTDPARWDGAIAAALAAHPQRLPGVPVDEAAPRLAAMVKNVLADVLATALPDGIRLDRIPPGRRIAELGFHLPVGRLTPHALADCLAAHGIALPALRFADLEGYLKGYIDLVFQHGERFYVLDWKSNHLGQRPEDYGPAPLAAAMAEHAYALQALIYSLALHRHLARRLPGYDPARHFGGALYLFVRGVRSGWEVDGAPAGVVFQRPSPALLADLDRLFEVQP